MKQSRFVNLSTAVLLVVLALGFLPATQAKAAGETITSTDTGGAWGDASTWVGGVVPDGVDDSVVIATAEGYNVTLSGATTVNGSLTVNSGAELDTGGFALTLEGDFVNNGTFYGGSSNIVIAGTASTQNIAGFETTGTVSMTKTAGTATFTGNVRGGGLTINGAGGTLNLGASRSHVFSGAWTRTNGTLDGGSSTIRLDGTVSGSGGTFTPGTGLFIYGGGAQSVAGVTYNNLRFQNSGAKTALGDITVNGNLTVNAGSNFTVGAFNLTVTGTTSITGTLTHSSPTGTKTFTGLVTINPGGAWKNDATGNADIHFRGGLTHKGAAFSAGTGTYYFETNDQAVGGTSGITIANLNVEAGRNLTNNNSGGLTVTNTLSGTGTLTQGATGVLNIGMTDANFTLATLDASAAGNTVNYSLGGDQTVRDTQYHNLTLSGSGVKTLPVGMTNLTGNLTLSGTASATTAADLDIDGNLSISNGAALTVGAFTFNVDGATSITGNSSSVNGKLVYGSATGAKTYVGSVTIGTYGVWDNSENSPVAFEGGLSFSGKTFTAGTGLYTFQTTASQTIGGTGAMSIPNLAVGAGVDLTNNNSTGLTVTTSLGGTGTLTQGASGILNIGIADGNFTLLTLVATADGNTVNYNGGVQTVRPIVYHHLTLSGNSAKTLTGLTTVNGNLVFSGTASATTADNLAIGGNLTVGSGTSLTVAGYDLTVTGSTSVSGSGILTFSNNVGAKLFVGSVSISGTWVNSGDESFTFRGGLGGSITSGNAGPTAVYTFETTATQTIDGSISVYNLAVAGGVTLTNNGTVTVLTDLGGAGAFTQGASSALSIGGTASVTTLTASAAGNTVKYNGGSPQTVVAITYHHLELSGGSTKTLPAGLTTVNGNLTVTGSGTLATLAAALTVGGNVSITSSAAFDVSASNYALNIGGNLTCTTANFTPRAGTVTLQGSSAQTINSSCSFYNFVMNNAAGATLATNNPTVNNVLTLTSGKITTGTVRTFIIGDNGSTSGGSAASYINGNLRKSFPTSGSPQSFTFAIGDATVYAPVDLTLASVDTGGTITAKTAAGEHPNIATVTGFNQNKDVNRYWTLTPATIVFSTCDATFNFDASELDAGATPTSFIVKRYDTNAAAWNSTTTGTQTATSTQATGIPYTTSSNVYSYAVGEGESVPPAITNVTSSYPDGAYKAGEVITGFTVTFDEAVTVTGTPQLTLETGANDAVLNYSGGSGTDTLSFSDYTVQAGDASSDLDALSLALNGGTIKDASNNAANLTLSGTSLATNKAIVIDTTAPETQIDTNPSNPSNSASSAFTYSANETATFECQMDGGGFGACASPYTLTDGSHTFDVRATDTAGNVDATPASYTWTIDTVAPTVLSSVRVHPTPTNRLTVQFTVTFSEAVTGVDTTDFSLTVSGITGASVTGVSGSGAVYTVTVNTGSGNGTLRLNVLDNDSIKDAALNPQNGAFTTGQSYTVNKTLAYKSVGVNDGWVLESSATSSKGGTINSSSTTFYLGDDASKKQYRIILHFNTSSLPDTAVITSVTLKIRKASGGSGNTSSLGALLADMTKPSFGTAGLAKTDFEASAGKPNTFNAFTIASNWYSAAMKSSGFTYVNRTGTTQFRLRFTKGDDGDGTADYLLFYSGNYGTASSRPQLIIQYYVP